MKPLARTLFGLALAGGLSGVWFTRTALTSARAENQRLRGEIGEVERLSRENAEMLQLQAEVQELEKLRKETRELYKLRNEVRQLREQKPEWDRLRADNQRLRARAESVGKATSRAPETPVLIAREQLTDAGLGSPEATLRTLFWAMREGNSDRLRRCFSDDALKQGNGQPIEKLQAGAAVLMAQVKGVRVVARKVVSTDQIKLGIQISLEGETDPHEVAFPLKRVGGDWKIELIPM